MRQPKLPVAKVEQQFRRMVFNVITRNQDDPVKHIAFLMDQQGNWPLSPALGQIPVNLRLNLPRA